MYVCKFCLDTESCFRGQQVEVSDFSVEGSLSGAVISLPLRPQVGETSGSEGLSLLAPGNVLGEKGKKRGNHVATFLNILLHEFIHHEKLTGKENTGKY